MDQFVAKSKRKAVAPKSNDVVVVNTKSSDNKSINVSGVGFSVDIEDGYISKYTNNGVDLITEPMRPNFWRASTDNDWRGWKVDRLIGFWSDAAEKLETRSINIEDVQKGRAAMITVEKAIGEDVKLQLIYTVNANGVVEVKYTLNKGEKVPEMLRIGLQCVTNKSLNDVSYYGRGPWENYSDRLSSAMINKYDTTVDGYMYEYAVPQECSNRCDVRWIALKGKSGSGIQIVGQSPLSVSVWNTTQESLKKAKHINEVVELESGNTLNIDMVQAGVGGTDSWSLKARPSDYARLLQPTYSYSFKIMGLDAGQDPIAVGRAN